MRLPQDPRWLQIAFLCSFLLLGLTARDFPIWHAPLLFAACLGTQLACERLSKLPHAGLLSPIIKLLLRAGAREAETLASLTGWEMDRIRSRMGADAPEEGKAPWWKNLWR